MLSALALDGLPEIRPRADLARLIAAAAPAGAIDDGVVVVVAHKVISKAEGRLRSLASIEPGERALKLAELLDKDARHVQAVLDESREVLRATRGVMICVTHHGFVCANAGVDASNVPGPDTVVLLPRDPDASARALRDGLRAQTGASPGVLVTDSFGRGWRHGQAEVALGCAGVSPLEDWRGRRDATGRELRATWIAVADQLASAADLARRKDGGQPVVLVRGAERLLTADNGPGAEALIRPEKEDLFR